MELFHICYEADTTAVVAGVVVAWVDIAAMEEHEVRVEAVDIVDIGTIAEARSGKKDEITGLSSVILTKTFSTSAPAGTAISMFWLRSCLNFVNQI